MKIAMVKPDMSQSMTDALVPLAPRGGHAGPFARPPGKAGVALPPALATWVARGRDDAGCAVRLPPGVPRPGV